MDFVTALCELASARSVDNLKMSDYGIQRNEIPTLAQNARETMGGLFSVDPCEISHQDVINIYEQSYQ